MQGKFLMGFVVSALLAASPAFAADSILDGPAPSPCGAALAGPDYVPGVDAMGRPVPRADIGAGRVPVPDQLLVPLPGGANHGRRGGRAGQGEPAYATIDGARLDRLVNPPVDSGACPPPATPRRR